MKTHVEIRMTPDQAAGVEHSAGDGSGAVWWGMSDRGYIDRARLAVEQLHGCGAIHRETVLVHEVLNRLTVWKGNVEVFDLFAHPKATRAFAWSHRDGKHGEDERFVTVLKVPRADSAVMAVRAQIAKDAREKREKPCSL
jgi:hypothetical protein